MNNLYLYNEIFKGCFGINEEDLTEKLEYNSIAEWDSVGHMALIAELEDAFDIMMDTDDVIEFSSYNIGKEILKKYNISF